MNQAPESWLSLPGKTISEDGTLLLCEPSDGDVSALTERRVQRVCPGGNRVVFAFAESTVLDWTAVQRAPQPLADRYGLDFQRCARELRNGAKRTRSSVG